MATLLEEVKLGRLDPDYVKMFLDCFSLFPVGSYVRLSSGTIARVISGNGPQHTKPVVLPLESDGSESDDPLDLSRCTGVSVIEALAEEDALGPLRPREASAAAVS